MNVCILDMCIYIYWYIHNYIYIKFWYTYAFCESYPPHTNRVWKNLQIAIAVGSGAWRPDDPPCSNPTMLVTLWSKTSRLGRWDRLRVRCPQHFSAYSHIFLAPKKDSMVVFGHPMLDTMFGPVVMDARKQTEISKIHHPRATAAGRPRSQPSAAIAGPTRSLKQQVLRPHMVSRNGSIPQ